VQPSVFGYLRSSASNADKPLLIRDELARYAERENLNLEAIFTDDGLCGATVTRPGFAALLDAVRTREGIGVLVPSRCHLSWRMMIRQKLEPQMLATGARLYVAWANSERAELRP
jgi:DNA invertase Pin-like site-specific DNA recombinase